MSSRTSSSTIPSASICSPIQLPPPTEAVRLGLQPKELAPAATSHYSRMWISEVPQDCHRNGSGLRPDDHRIHISNTRITGSVSNTGAMVSALFIEIALSGAFLGEIT